MPKYEVKLKALAEVKTYIEVEAPTAAEALKIAKAQLENETIDIDGQNGRMDFQDWDLAYIYDSPISCPESKGVRVTDVSNANLGWDDPEWIQDEDGL